MVDKLPLPDAARWIAYDAIVSALQSADELKRTVKGWHTYSGRPHESAEFGRGGYPCVAIVPLGGPVTPETPVSQETSMSLKIDIGTPGLSVRNLFALWEAIERAAFTGQARLDLRGRIEALAADRIAAGKPAPRIVSLQLSLPAIKPEADGTDAGVMLATGTATLKLLV